MLVGWLWHIAPLSLVGLRSCRCKEAEPSPAKAPLQRQQNLDLEALEHTTQNSILSCATVPSAIVNFLTSEALGALKARVFSLGMFCDSATAGQLPKTIQPC